MDTAVFRRKIAMMREERIDAPTDAIQLHDRSPIRTYALADYVRVHAVAQRIQWARTPVRNRRDRFRRTPQSRYTAAVMDGVSRL